MKKTFLLKTLLLLCALVAGSSSVWAQISSAAPSNGKSYVVAAYVNSKYYALPNGTVNGATITGTEVTLNTDNKVNTSVASGKAWTLEVNSENANQFYLKYTSGGKTYYLYKNGTGKTNYNFKVSEGSMNYWSFTTNGTGYTVAAIDRGTNNVNINNDGGTFSCKADATPIILLEIGDVAAYTITAQSNDNDKGTVELSGTVITATPKDGYRVKAGAEGYTVTSGTATVVNNGDNTFTVTPTSACTVQINFEEIPALTSIVITTPPTKTTYTDGETFDATGMVVTATYTDSSEDDVTASCTWTPSGVLTTSDTEINVSYTENGITKTATCDITVTVAPVITFDFSTNGFSFPSGSTNKTTASNNYSDGVYTFNLSGGGDGNGYYHNSSYLLMGKSGCSLTFPAFGFNVSKIKVYGTSGASGDVKQNIFVGEKAVSTETTGAKNVNHEYEISSENQDAGTIYILKVTSSHNTQISKIEIFGYAPVTITPAEYATFSSPYATDFSATGITVYTATDNETSVTLNEVATGKVPANTPVVLYKAGADGTPISVPVIVSADAIGGTNDLTVSTANATTDNSANNEYMFVLAKKSETVGFYHWTGGTLSTGKIYLQGKASYGAREFLGFGNDSETTGIDKVQVSGFKIQDSEVYNLNGQRVMNPTKGLYIVNGRKVVVK